MVKEMGNHIKFKWAYIRRANQRSWKKLNIVSPLTLDDGYFGILYSDGKHSKSSVFQPQRAPLTSHREQNSTCIHAQDGSWAPPPPTARPPYFCSSSSSHHLDRRCWELKWTFAKFEVSQSLRIPLLQGHQEILCNCRHLWEPLKPFLRT